MPPFSRRSSLDLSPNDRAQALAERRERGAEILDLTVGNPTLVGLAADARDIAAALAHPRGAVYDARPLGLPEARASAAGTWRAQGMTPSPDQIVLTASTSEAYSHLFKLLCDPGDAVLVPRPSYPLLEHLAHFDGVELLPYSLRYDGAWHVDRDELRRGAEGGARAVLVVTPNNPTGSFLRRDDLEAITALGLPIISDEVFGAYELARPAAAVRSALEATDALVFALGGLSKLALLPQLKLAWVAVGGPRRSVDTALARLELIADTYLGVGTSAQLGLPKLLALGAELRARALARLRRNAAALTQALEGSVAGCLGPEGGWYAPLRLPAALARERWTLQLLREEGVLVQPGWLYDLHTPPALVLSLLTEPETFDEGVRRMLRALRRWERQT